MVEFVKFTIPIEYRIVELLMKNAGRVFFSISEIYERVWKEPGFNAENTVAVHIRKIREKIEIDPKNPRYIKGCGGLATNGKVEPLALLLLLLFVYFRIDKHWIITGPWA